MIWSNYLYNGTQIDVSNSNFEITLDDNLNPRELNHSDEISNIESYHGVTASPTYARGRVIGLSGYIVSSTKAGFWEGMNYLDSLFSLQWNTWILQTKPFQFTDDFWNNWVGEVKVKVPIKYWLEQFDTHHFISKWTVVLLAPDPKLFAPFESSQSGEEWFVWGVAITEEGVAITEDWIALNENSWTFIITPSGWNQPLEPRFEITVLKDVNQFLRLKNVTSGNYIQFNIEATPEQVFIIDSSKETATLDGVNIMATKTWWDFIVIDWKSEIEIYDVDDIFYWNDLNITAYYKNILL